MALLQCREPSGSPEAEVWMGTHPRGPSSLEMPDGSRRDLQEVAGTLPFLLKILAADRGLSIQVHPDRAGALEGFEREEALAIPRDAPHRRYHDGNHKPEILCALGDFWALAGFRQLRELHNEMRGLPREITGEFVDAPSEESFRDLFQQLISPGERALEDILAVVRGASHGGNRRWGRYWWVRQLSRQFPGDPGALAPLYLNLFHLQKGEGLFLEPRTLHAYLRGTGVELMASSDNVLRSGCTEKHVDSEELLRVLDFQAPPPRKLKPRPVGSGSLVVWDTPAEDFQLLRIDRPLTCETRGAPAVVVNLGRGCDGEPPACNGVAILPGCSVFVTRDTETVTITGAEPMEVYVAVEPGTWQPVEGSAE